MSEEREQSQERRLASPASGDSATSGSQALGALNLKQRKTGGGGGLKNIQVTIPSASIAAKLPQNMSAAETIDRERRRGPTKEEIAEAAEHATQAAELLAAGDHTVALEQYNLAAQKDPTNMEHQIGHTWANYVCGLTRASNADRRFQNLLKQVDAGDYTIRSRILRYQADVVLAAGDRDRAHKLYGQSKSADPKNTEAATGFESTFPIPDAKNNVGGWFSRMFNRKK